jgi:hypothetical protein
MIQKFSEVEEIKARIGLQSQEETAEQMVEAFKGV